MVSKSSLPSRIAAGLAIVLLAALPALAQTTPAPAPAVPPAPATPSATVAPPDQHGATEAQKEPQKKAGAATAAKETHKDGLSVVRKHHAQTAQTPAKKAEEPVKTDSAGQRL